MYRTVLKTFTNNDFDRLISWIKDKESLIQFAGTVFSYPLTKDQLEKYLEDKKRFTFKVVTRDDQQTIGHVEIYRENETTCRLCRILIGDINFRGKGLCLEIVEQLVNYCLIEFKCSKINLNVYDWNLTAIKCYEKAGFKTNSEKFKEININGKLWKSINMIYDR